MYLTEITSATVMQSVELFFMKNYEVRKRTIGKADDSYIISHTKGSNLTEFYA